MYKDSLIQIIGPTGVGKTSFAFQKVAELLSNGFAGVDVVSVDSRQVYQGLEVLTGADVPAAWLVQTQPDLPYPFFVAPDKRIRLHGISIVKPDFLWSVTEFVTFARAIIRTSSELGRAVMLVGGTGLYHRALLSQADTFQVPPNDEIRVAAAAMNVSQLQDWLSEENPKKLAAMNESDRANKRRLIRQIEVAEFEQSGATFVSPKSADDPDWTQVKTETYLLSRSLAQLQRGITQRVKQRFAGGAVSEVEQLEKLGLSDTAPVWTTLGIPEIKQFLTSKLSAAECQQLWALHEFQYAKRQLTWWRKYAPQDFHLVDVSGDS